MSFVLFHSVYRSYPRQFKVISFLIICILECILSVDYRLEWKWLKKPVLKRAGDDIDKGSVPTFYNSDRSLEFESGY